MDVNWKQKEGDVESELRRDREGWRRKKEVGISNRPKGKERTLEKMLQQKGMWMERRRRF